jgi:hypothetical protein
MNRNRNRNPNPNRPPFTPANGSGLPLRLRLRLGLRLGLSRTGWLLLTASVVLALSAAAIACNVPVFRFALERWRADPYRAVLFHRGPLSDEQRDQIRELEEQQDTSQLNLELRLVDADQLDETAEESAADAALLAAHESAQLPLLVVQYPAHLSIDKPVWGGGLDRQSIVRLTDSPVRQELVRRLAAGQTAVWLLLESGNASDDDAAAALLEEELVSLEKDLKLPELTTAPEDNLLADLPLAVDFSLLRVPRNDAEQALVAMLIGCEPDLAERTDPMVFPVFGRGRALLPLIGAGITARNVHDSAQFLVGPCSCEVKELNPGFDLLLAADWDSLLSSTGIPLAPAAAATKLPAEPELVPIPSGAASTNAESSTSEPASAAAASPEAPQAASDNSHRTLLFGGIALAGVAVVISLIAAATRGRHGSERP